MPTRIRRTRMRPFAVGSPSGGAVGTIAGVCALYPGAYRGAGRAGVRHGIIGVCAAIHRGWRVSGGEACVLRELAAHGAGFCFDLGPFVLGLSAAATAISLYL